MPEINETPHSAGNRHMRYERPPEVETEIALLPAGTGSDFCTAVAGAEALETIVHGIRRLVRAGVADDAGVLTDVLIDRAAPILERIARRHFRDSPEDQKDARQEAAEQIIREIADTSPKEEFWEVNFISMVSRACSDAADRIRRQRERERPFRRIEEIDWDEERNYPDTTFTGDEFDPFHRDLIISEALTVLDGNVRRAAYLRLHGMKEESKTDEPTIARVLGVSGRMVRTYLKQAEDRLTEWSKLHT